MVLLSVPRGVRVPLRLRANGPAPSVSLSSDDFAAGELPSGPGGEGWIVFPRTDATPACFHSAGGTRVVSIPFCEDLPDLRASWETGDTMTVSVVNTPPRAARLEATEEVPSGSLRYTLSHPRQLFGAATRAQPVRTCPNPPPPPPPPDPPLPPPDPGDPDPGSGSGGDEILHCCDHHPCTHDYQQAVPRPLPPDPPPDGPPPDDPDDPETLRDVLVLHRSPAGDGRPLAVEVPEGQVEGCTCACPEHRSSHVSLWYGERPARIRVTDADGAPATIVHRSQDVMVTPLAPSTAVGDARLVLALNGEPREVHDYTVLGLDVTHPELDLDDLELRDPSVGVPMVASTNAAHGLALTLHTDVDLPFGDVTIGFADATTTFTAWLDVHGGWRPILSGGQGAVTYGIAGWRAFTGVSAACRDTRLAVTASGPGTCRLVFHYEGTTPDGRVVRCTKRRRVTACRLSVEEIRFNHDVESHARDAVSIRKDYLKAYSDLEGEWRTGGGTPGNDPACYVGGTVPTVKARFRVEPHVGSMRVAADAVGGDGVLGNLRERHVPFSGGLSDWVEFNVDAAVPRVVRRADLRWSWKVSRIGTADVAAFPAAETGPHRVYATLDAPVAPWNPNGVYDDRNPRVDALELACAAANGRGDKISALAAITSHLFNNMGFVYETKEGGSKFSRVDDFFLLSGYLAPGGKTVNCQDQAYGVATFGNLLGIHSTPVLTRPFGYLNTVNLVGVGPCNNPGYSDPEATVHVPVAGEDDIQRFRFGHHMYVFAEGRIFDACVGPELGTKGHLEYLWSVIDSSTEAERLYSIFSPFDDSGRQRGFRFKERNYEIK